MFAAYAPHRCFPPSLGNGPSLLTTPWVLLTVPDDRPECGVEPRRAEERDERRISGKRSTRPREKVRSVHPGGRGTLVSATLRVPPSEVAVADPAVGAHLGKAREIPLNDGRGARGRGRDECCEESITVPAV